jgi:kinesin family member 2/24
MKGGKANPLD